MAEEPKQEAPGAQVSEQNDAFWSRVKDFFRNQPTFGLTLLYLYVTGVGIVYSAALYGRFGINIFDYSEIADFLLAAFKNPFAFLFVGLLGALVSISMLFSREFETVRLLRNLSLPTLDEKIEHIELVRSRWTRRVAIIFTLTIVLGSLTLPYYFASRTASSIKHGEHPTIDVRYRSFSGSAGQLTEPGLELIGATQKAVFFYDICDKRTIIIPQAQIVSIEVPE